MWWGISRQRPPFKWAPPKIITVRYDQCRSGGSSGGVTAELRREELLLAEQCRENPTELLGAAWAKAWGWEARPSSKMEELGVAGMQVHTLTNFLKRLWFNPNNSLTGLKEGTVLRFLKKILFIYLFLEREEGKERGTKTSMCGCLSCIPYWGLVPQPRNIPWTGNRTGDTLICRPVLDPLSHTSQGKRFEL